MNKLIRYIFLFISLVSIFGCSSGINGNKLRVVATTSLISTLVRQIGNDKVSVSDIIPANQCPGTFDIKPNDVKNLSNADLFIMHGWQGEKFTDEIIRAADNPKLRAENIDIQGSWMIPSAQISAAEKIASILCECDAANSVFYKNSLNSYKQSVYKEEKSLSASIEDIKSKKVNVICSDQQAEFARWLGLNVVMTYGTPDTMTPQLIKNIVAMGQSSNVTMIIDNLQSGENAGSGIAEALSCKRVILSNFPGAFAKTETWNKAVEANLRIVVQCLNNASE